MATLSVTYALCLKKSIAVAAAAVLVVKQLLSSSHSRELPYAMSVDERGEIAVRTQESKQSAAFFPHHTAAAL
jgi:hypothetical protein